MIIQVWEEKGNSVKNTLSPSSTLFSVPHILVSPYPKGQILDFSEIKEFADDNFKFDENGRKFFKRLENTVEKGEIARYEQFLLFPQCFQKTYTARHVTRGP